MLLSACQLNASENASTVLLSSLRDLDQFSGLQEVTGPERVLVASFSPHLLRTPYSSTAHLKFSTSAASVTLPSSTPLPMPSHLQTYEVLLDFTNDSRDCATIQLLRDYGQATGAIVLLHPGESITLVLDAGAIYRYALKTHSKVANVTWVVLFWSSTDSSCPIASARTWRDIRCDVSQMFANLPSPSQRTGSLDVNGITVDRIWRDYRMCVWNDS
jgi:hypothetical protein